MIVTLVGKNSLYKTKLPEITMGNYWITDENEKKIVNIEGKNGGWEITSNDSMKIIDLKDPTSIIWNKATKISKKVVDRIILKENSINYIYFKNIPDTIFILFAFPSYENNFEHLIMKESQKILIGSSDECHIRYISPLIKPKHARIFFNRGQLMLENYDNVYGTFINNSPVTSRLKLLFNGDVIFIMGLKIIIMGNGIFVNNPFNRASYNKKFLEVSKSKQKDIHIDEEDDSDVELYTEKDYFARAPRITNIIERETIKIDSPPENQNKNGTPLFLVLGSTLGMGVIMLISTLSTVTGIKDGSAGKDVFLSIFVSVAMLICMILFPILNDKYEKKKKKENEETRQKRYREYINSKIELIDKIMEKQKNILYENYISAEECAKIIIHKESRLWERKIEDVDFLKIRLGIGDVPLEADIEYPEVEFTMEDDDLVDIVNTIANKSKIIKNVPITISLAEKFISGLIVENDERLIEKFVQNLIMQLVTLHSYEDLKLVFLLKEDRTKRWEHLKTLPHIWDNAKQFRFWADDYNDMKEISRYLEEVLMSRLEHNDVDYKSFKPYYLIITDDYKKIEHLKIITEILELKTNIGFGIFCITNNFYNLPDACQVFINLNNDKGIMYENEMTSTEVQKEFSFDPSYTFFFEKMGKQLSDIPIKYTATSTMSLPTSYTFLEMYDVGKIEQLNILKRWKTNDSTVSLQAPIGIDSAGMPIVLDIHEKFHGPHGLVAGSTGSGKSEFIITYILSLAINYHPDDVTLILIDYKGGGLAGAFKKNNIQLPHLVGVITNIDKNGLQRSLVSIQSELRSRQVLFNEAREKTNEGTIDIYKYQKLYHEGIVDKPIPHLLIICDEFAELKQQQEDFMDELISVARIGRSLGVHLILATQKPAGIVNDQIRSNSKFSICLKVQDKEDSVDVIGRPDAADLKRAGQFYMQVGNNEYFALGQSAWAGAQYIPSDTIKKNVENSIRFISNIGDVIKEVGNSKKTIGKASGEQLTNIVEYICQIAKYEHIQAEPLWMENIPEEIFIEDVKQKYNIKVEKNVINPVIGEYDDPFNQRQGIVQIDFSKQGNVVIYGNAESGRETLLSTMVYDLITTHTADEVELYILDFGSEALKIFKDAPVVGDVAFLSDNEKIGRLFEMIQKEIKERIQKLSDYGGNYNLYISENENKMPMMIIVINNYEVFEENYEDKYDDMLLTLTREGLKCGIEFVITTTAANTIRYRLAQNFKQKIALQLNDEDDYLNIFDGIGKKRPSHLFGRGMIRLEDIYEFQTARICKPEVWNKYIKEVINQLKSNSKTFAKNIPILPSRVTLDDIKEKISDIEHLPIGIKKKTLDIYEYNLQKRLINIVTGKNIDIVAKFTEHFLELLKLIDNVSVTMFDAERIFKQDKNNLSLNFKNFSLEISNNLKKNKNVVCIIVGIDKFINDIEDGETAFDEMLTKAEELKNYSFVLVENYTKLKNREYDDWYKKYISNDSGIWVGNGINDQYLISVNTSDSNVINNCGESFGYVIDREEPTLIKLLGMREKGDEDG